MSVIFQTSFMKTVATYWGPIVSDGYGSGTFPTPISIKCRWEDKQEKFVDRFGNEKVSHAVVYPNIELQPGGWLLKGESTADDPRTIAGADEVKAYAEHPSLNQTMKQVIAWL